MPLMMGQCVIRHSVRARAGLKTGPYRKVLVMIQSSRGIAPADFRSRSGVGALRRPLPSGTTTALAISPAWAAVHSYNPAS